MIVALFAWLARMLRGIFRPRRFRTEFGLKIALHAMTQIDQERLERAGGDPTDPPGPRWYHDPTDDELRLLQKRMRALESGGST
jgi:hypothetical protein